MVGNEISRWTSLIYRTAYLRSFFRVLRRNVAYTFHDRLDFLSGLFLFGDFRRRWRKFQLNLSVKRGKFGFQLFQFVLLLPYLPGYLLQL